MSVAQVELQSPFHVLSVHGSGEDRSLSAIQSERPIQGKVTVIHALRGIFLDDLRKRVHQAPASRFREHLMRGRLELTVDRQDVAGVDDAELGSAHDAAPGFIVVLQVSVLQLLRYRFDRKEVVFQQTVLRSTTTAGSTSQAMA